MTGHKGFYYHFLDMTTGRRADLCELSTVDTSFLPAGMLTAAVYFDQDCEAEQEIRTLAHALYRRTDWQWACNGGATVTMGGSPRTAFCPTAGKLIFYQALGLRVNLTLRAPGPKKNPAMAIVIISNGAIEKIV